MARRPQTDDVVVEVVESRFDDIARVVVEIVAVPLIFLRFHGWADLLGVAAVIVLLLNLRGLRPRFITVTSSALKFRGRQWTADEIESVHFRARSFWRTSAVTVRLKDDRADVHLPPAREESHRRIVASLEEALSARHSPTETTGS